MTGTLIGSPSTQAPPRMTHRADFVPDQTQDPDLPLTLEQWQACPPKRQEWIDGTLVEKQGMTIYTGRATAKLLFALMQFVEVHEPEGWVVTEAACRTTRRGRIPDLAYVPPEMVGLAQGQRTFPQSFPWIAEIVSPTDQAEADVFLKAREYLESGSQEVWLIVPESRWILTCFADRTGSVYGPGQTLTTQTLLAGFSIGVDQLLNWDPTAQVTTDS